MIAISKNNNVNYINQFMALAALQAAQIYFTQKGYLNTSRISPNVNTLELTVYFGHELPHLPETIKCSSYDITSHEYFSPAFNKPDRVRACDYYFKYKK